MPLLFWTLLAAALFCMARGVADLRAGRHAWGGAGLLIGLGLMSLPVPTHAVKVDLPAAPSR